MSNGARYALLPDPGGNRVYGSSVASLTEAELAFVSHTLLDDLVSDTHVVELGGADYLVFETSRRVSADDVAVLSNLSTLHVLFELEGELLRPVPVARHQRWDGDILTIQRYAGKTNEQFTKLLVNVTLAAAGDSFHRMLRGEPVRLLDPLCGRGTTLNLAVLRGLEAAGIELQKSDVELYREFVIRWLKDKRIKHKVNQEVHRKGREAPVRLLDITYWAKDDPEQKHTIEVVNGDTVDAAEFFKARSIDVIATDLPYGVQHQAKPAGGRPRRRPDELIAEALPVWSALLRPGGAMGLAWNRRTLSRDRLIDVVDGAGLTVCSPVAPDAFVHVVDRSITRDLLVATK